MRISETDKDFTDRMLKAGKYLDVVVSDHLIISEKQYVSLEKIGVMEELRHNGVYELVKKDQAEIKDLWMEIEKDKSEKQAKLEIGQKMKAEGYSNELIKKLTGLPLRDIKKL
jgi:DNA repair protein RadC